MTKPTDPQSLEGATALTEDAAPTDPLAKLRRPFPPHQISKLPKETGTQAKKRKEDQATGKWPAKCSVCEGYHHPNAVHLDYVGHAALTDRLLDTDLHWTWEPAAYTSDGLPAFDRNGGLWIKLTVCGVTRLGYGSADGKTGGDAVKEIIGDALRNAAMRFGAALDLWHKGDLHLPEGESDDTEDREAPKTPDSATLVGAAKAAIGICASRADLDDWRAKNAKLLERLGKDDPEAFDAIVVAWKAAAKAIAAADPFAEAA
jgi:hypothetical protein